MSDPLERLINKPAVIPHVGMYGRLPDKPDARDHRFVTSHPRLMMTTQVPPLIDWSGAPMPPCFDQGQLGSCGFNAGAGFMAHLYPGFMGSRLQGYYDGRKIEGNTATDAGIQTRDVFRMMQQTGYAPESDWPYDVSKFAFEPPPNVEADAAAHKIGSYSRLVTEEEMFKCLAAGGTFILGFEVYSSFEGPVLAGTGVMTQPNMDTENIVGGHDVQVVGYDLRFKSNPDFLKSGADPALVSDQALKIRNSWGPNWGLNGHFWMPVPYATNPSTGGDSWTGVLATATPVPSVVVISTPAPTEESVLSDLGKQLKAIGLRIDALEADMFKG